MGPMRSMTLLLLVSLTACAGNELEEDDPSPRAAGTVDKRSLYGDPALMPTREGERRRTELALAGAIDRALDVLDVDDRTVNVELDPRTRDPLRVLVVGQVRADAPPDRGEQVAEIVASVVGPLPAPGPTITLARAQDPGAPQRALPWLVAVAFLGLGFNAGVVFDRGRRHWNRRSARR